MRNHVKDRCRVALCRLWSGLWISFLIGPAATTALLAAEGMLAIKAERVFVGNGQVVVDGVVLIEAGRVKAVGAGLAVPDDVQVIEVENGCVTPGLVA